MTAAAGLLLNGAWIAIAGAPILERSTRRFTAGWGLVAWCAAIISVLASWAAAAVAAGYWLLQAGGPLHRLLAGCVSTVQLLLDTTSVEAVEVALRGTVAVAVVTLIGVLARLCLVLHRTRARTHRHCRIAWLVGERRAEAGNALVIETAQRCVYCVAGRPAAIVVTRGALDALDDRQLAAVLAHERAHLAERHHLPVALSRGVATVLPRVRLFRDGARAIGRLIEMRADDVALRNHAGSALAGALLVLAGGPQVASTALGATTSDVTERVERLLLASSVDRVSAPKQLALTVALPVAAPVLSFGFLVAASPLCRILLG